MKLGVELLVQNIPQENVLGGQVLELLCFGSVVGQYSILQVSDVGISPPWEVSKRSNLPLDRWMLGFAMYSTGISLLN